MPFTFSHPAIILPLTRLPKRYYSLTGLIVGSAAPDFEYFFRMDTCSEYSHSLAGLFLFNLPVGLFLCFVFHGLVKKELIANLPVFFRERAEPLLKLDWAVAFRKNFIVICLSIVIGAASHLFWDGFTHANEYGIFTNFFGYQSVSVGLSGHRIYLYNILQHLSTLAGLLFIYRYMKQMPVSGTSARGKINYTYWIFVLLVCGIISAVRLLTSGTGTDAFGKIILTLIAAFLSGLVLAPFCIRNKERSAFSL